MGSIYFHPKMRVFEAAGVAKALGGRLICANGIAKVRFSPSLIPVKEVRCGQLAK
jgi:hypothetical protein